MARKKSKSKSSFKKYITLFVIIVGVICLLAQYFYPQEFAQAKTWVQTQVSELQGKVAERTTSDSVSAQSANSEPVQVVKAEGSDLAPANYQPAVAKKLQILKNIGYISGFSNELRVPLWVGYVTTYPFKYETVERPSTFIQDTRAYGSAEHHDYSNSGYDRGHMAPNYVIGKCYGEKAQMETFLMTNIIPQKPKLNRKQWKELEQYIANNLAKKYGKVLVFTGPVFESSNIEKIKGKVAIPTSCYMIIVVQNAKKEIFAIGFILPQVPTKKSIWDYCVSIDDIESLTGIDFLPQLPDDVENAVESNRNALPFKN